MISSSYSKAASDSTTDMLGLGAPLFRSLGLLGIPDGGELCAYNPKKITPKRHACR